MKYGFRTPSVKKRVTSRTKTQLTRTVKKATNPLYGKKGMGYVKDPERAAKNAIYKKTTARVGAGSSSSGCSVTGVVVTIVIVVIALLWWLINSIFK